ncbi:MAG: signal recognition particle-docking protein FtsY [Actinomycetota bacterium]|nr:signal recognition particle-docking protein FtsY [Actinomycetota bacterium]
MEFLVLAIAILVVGLVTLVGLLRRPGRVEPERSAPRVPPASEHLPGLNDDSEVPRDTPTKTVDVLDLPDAGVDTADRADTAETAEPAIGAVQIEPPARTLDDIAPTAGRLVRLRARLARSESVFGRGLLALLSRDVLDEDVWEEIEDTLLTADMGVKPATELVEALRTRVKVLGVRTPEGLRALLKDELLAQVGTTTDRSLAAARHAGEGDGDAGRPAVLLVVGVNGTGKTTTCGKLARVLVADGRSVVMGAADTFRAAAADQLATWAERVGADVVRGPEGGDPASVAFDAVKRGTESGVDAVLIDTAGRLHNKVGLMDELVKVKRVVEKHGPIDEVLLVLDATTGQNGVVQAKTFTQAVDVTGIVLTKLDGTAKGGIVIAVQRELGIPVKLVGLGEGPDDLAPFEPEAFVDALLGDPEAEAPRPGSVRL